MYNVFDDCEVVLVGDGVFKTLTETSATTRHSLAWGFALLLLREIRADMTERGSELVKAILVC